LCSLFVKHLGDVQVGETRKAVLRVTSRFTEPVDVEIALDDLDKFFVELSPVRFRLMPGETREVEVFLHPRRYDIIGRDIGVRLVFKASTVVETVHAGARPAMNIYVIDQVEVVISPGSTPEESGVVETFAREKVVLYKSFFYRNPYHVALPITSTSEVVGAEVITIAISPPIAEAPDIPLLSVISHPSVSEAPHTLRTQTINNPEVTWS